MDKYAELTTPLRELLSKDKVKLVWTQECESALNKIKAEFMSDKVLMSPDFSKHFTLFTDASNVALGACLMQEKGNKLYPVQYLSRALSPTEQRYAVIEKECLAIVWALSKLQKYLLERHFTLIIDHKPLITINKKMIMNSKINRWALILLDFKFEIKTVKGQHNTLADFLSRQIEDEKKKNMELTKENNDLRHISQCL